MNPDQLVLDRHEAARLYRAYKKHANYSQPIDWEVQRAYQLLAKGRLIIKALESVVSAGLNDQGLPKLALASAAATTCYLTRFRTGAMWMSTQRDHWRRSNTHTLKWRDQRFEFPADTFPPAAWNPGHRVSQTEHSAQVPLVPVHMRPRRGLPNYHVLWEAEWQPEPARDPYLLRRIGKSDMWVVMAQWDLTEVERAALRTRIAA
jgi:hypothetical protein